MLRVIKEITLEVFQAILPLTIGVIAINFLFIRMPAPVLIQFIFGAVMVIGGMILFLLGVRLGILPMGEAVGSELPKRRFVPYILAVAFLMGFSVTVAEPDVMVLSDQVNTVSGGSISNTLLVGVIAVGVGFFVAAAILRIILGFPITYMLAGGYIAIIILSFFAPPEFVPVAFDAGGVTTGPVTVPVILALGIGFSSVLAGRSTLSDGFGLIGLASIGPVIGVMLMGVILY